MDFSNKTYFSNFVKFCAILGAIIGFILGIFYSVGGLMVDTLVSVNLLSPSSVGTPGLGQGTLMAFGALIGMPILFAFGSILIGIVIAGTTNLLQAFNKKETA